MTAEIVTADAFDALADMDTESAHAAVTDPPYALGDSGFMGQEWDNFSDSKTYQKWCEKWAEKCRRVLKPGGHLLAFGGNTRHHRLFSGVEDAGFEVRDTLTWHYGSGFPKALDVSKAIDKAAGAEREVVGQYVNPRTGDEHNYPHESDRHTAYGYDKRDGDSARAVTAPATDAARKWDGWKTALKPATEFIVLARKPLSEGTVAENVQRHGTAALNIDENRIETTGRPRFTHGNETTERFKAGGDPGELPGSRQDGETTEGRYPANVIFDAEAAGALDRRNEHTTSTPNERHNSEQAHNDSKYGDASEGGWVSYGHNDAGGPSRYFYTSKATRSERTLDGKIENAHPTVKPIDLMEWLVRLVTAERQIVLDPFCGTGTTLRAAKNLDRQFIGIEQSEQWADVARARCGLTPEQPDRFTDAGQTTLATGGDP